MWSHSPERELSCKASGDVGTPIFAVVIYVPLIMQALHTLTCNSIWEEVAKWDLT